LIFSRWKKPNKPLFMNRLPNGYFGLSVSENYTSFYGYGYKFNRLTVTV